MNTQNKTTTTAARSQNTREIVRRPHLSFDGRGINGPDIHRSRVATFTSAQHAHRYGKLFAAAPAIVERLEALRDSFPRNAGFMFKRELDSIIALAGNGEERRKMKDVNEELEGHEPEGAGSDASLADQETDAERNA